MTDTRNTTSDRRGATSGSASTARDEAASVAGDAKQAGGRVADTAKDGAVRVADETKSQARRLANDATQELREQAAEQQKRVAAGIRSTGQELRSMAESSSEQSVATEVVQQAAQRASSIADWLDARDPGSLLYEVKQFARRRPGYFIAIAIGTGVVAGRLTRALADSSGSESAGMHARDRIRVTGNEASMRGTQVPEAGSVSIGPDSMGGSMGGTSGLGTDRTATGSSTTGQTRTGQTGTGQSGVGPTTTGLP